MIGYEPSLNGRPSNESVNTSPALRPKRPIASRSPCDALTNVVRLVARRTISLFVNVASVPPPPAINTRTVQALVTWITDADVLRCPISAPTFCGGGSKDWQGGSVALGWPPVAAVPQADSPIARRTVRIRRPTSQVQRVGGAVPAATGTLVR